MSLPLVRELLAPSSTTAVDDPPLYHIVLINDNVTPMDFVIHLLMKLFHHQFHTAKKTMLLIHHHGRGIAGTYPFDIAEAKARDSVLLSRSYGYPLRCVTESELA